MLFEAGDGVVVVVVRRDVPGAGVDPGQVSPFRDEASEPVAWLVQRVDVEPGIAAGEGVLAGAKRRPAGARIDLGLPRDDVDFRATAPGLDPQEAFCGKEDGDVGGVDTRGLFAGCRPAMLEGDGAPLDEEGVAVVLGFVCPGEAVETQGRLDIDTQDVPVGENRFGARGRTGGDPVPDEDRRVRTGGGVVLSG